MRDSELAMFGGSPAIVGDLPGYPSLGSGEREAVNRVMDRGCLSGFYGSWGEHFYGGPEVRQLEQAWSERFDIKHSVSMNSATSGLFAAIAAVGVSPGDEVIVPPLTMSATVVAPLLYGAIPVFADVEADTFCLDPNAVEAAITSKTKAIIAVNLFGHAARLAELRAIADRHDLALIEDNAQGPLAKEMGAYAGTVADIGVFSLNYHKHIHAGEGGICVTADDDLYQRLCLIRNHGENVVEDLKIDDLTNLVGFNFRLTELSAAIANSQLQRVDQHVAKRVQLAERLSETVANVPGLEPPVVREGCQHVYYVWALKFDAEAFGCSRELFSQALTAEGFPHGVGYVRPLYQLPLFQKQVAIGSHGFPFANQLENNSAYDIGCCPIAEQLHHEQLVIAEPCQFDCEEGTIERLATALAKVAHAREALAAAGQLAVQKD